MAVVEMFVQASSRKLSDGSFFDCLVRLWGQRHTKLYHMSYIVQMREQTERRRADIITSLR